MTNKRDGRIQATANRLNQNVTRPQSLIPKPLRPAILQPKGVPGARLFPHQKAPNVGRMNNAAISFPRPAAFGPSSRTQKTRINHAGPVGRPHVVQRAARHSARIADPNYSHSVIPLVGGMMIAPQTIDKHGTHYWNGYRPLSFDAATFLAMAPSKGAGCKIGKVNCTGAAVSIDHIVDFATTQSALPTHSYCDGTHHWTGVLLSDAKADYNNIGNLQWACTSCNSSKSGVKGLYAPPSHAGLCPGPGCVL